MVRKERLHFPQTYVLLHGKRVLIFKQLLEISSSSQINSTSTISSTPSSTASSNLEQENQEETLDTEEFDYFDQAKKEIKELIESEQVEQAKEKGKEYFITGVDFIFYDKEINGVTFDDLTEEGKKVTLENL